MHDISNRFHAPCNAVDDETELLDGVLAPLDDDAFTDVEIGVA